MDAPSPTAPSIRVDVAIVGAGFAGLAMAIALDAAGTHDLVVLERADALGGTWRDNRYPGCACDIPSSLYAYSFAPNPRWTRTFAPQPEILDYLHRCADDYALHPRIRYRCALVEARFDEACGRWRLRGSDGTTFDARVLVLAIGALSEPALPALPGIERFRGAQFHSATWDRAYRLDGKRVAVIGTGASAVQFVPAIADRVEHLHLFQRTPPWILPKRDHALSERRRDRDARQPWRQRLRRAMIFWALEARVPGFRHPPAMRLVQLQAARHLRRAIADPALRARLTPGYRLGCKRVLISNDFYPALTRPNVELVDGAVAEVRADAIVDADGVERPVDAIIYGTGFRTQAPVPPGMIMGLHGQDLAARWARDFSAYRGTTVAGFPNLFVLVGPNSGLGHNSMIGIIEAQVHYVTTCLREMRARGLAWIDVREDAQARYNARLQDKLRGAVWGMRGGCRSWYQDADGKVTALWPGFAFGFRLATRRSHLHDYHQMPDAPSKEGGGPRGGLPDDAMPREDAVR